MNKITRECAKEIFKSRIEIFNRWRQAEGLSFPSWCCLVLETCLRLIGIKIYKLKHQ